MLDISFLLEDGIFTTTFTLVEPQIEFVEGEWVVGDSVKRVLHGTVRPTSQKDLERLAEGDRVTGSTTFWYRGKLSLDISSNIAPSIEYKGATYKIIQVMDYTDSGFTKIFGQLEGRDGTSA